MVSSDGAQYVAMPREELLQVGHLAAEAGVGVQLRLCNKRIQEGSHMGEISLNGREDEKL